MGWSQQAVGLTPGWGPANLGSTDPGGHGSSGQPQGRYPAVVWVWFRGRGWRLRGGCPGGEWVWCRPRGGDPAVCRSGTGLWPGQPEGWRAGQNRAVVLQAYRVGICQAGYCFIRSWHEEAFHDLRV
jgi:hypothetical protein